MVLGDSLSSAYGMATDQGWVNLLQQRLAREGYPHRVVNASISGDTTAGARTRLETALTRHKPDMVIVELGGNDGLRGQAPGGIRENLRAIIETVLAAEARPILMSMRIPPNYGPDYTAAFEQVYTELASQTRIPLLPFPLANVATRPELMQADQVHPSADAQPIILDNLWVHLIPHLTP